MTTPKEWEQIISDRSQEKFSLLEIIEAIQRDAFRDILKEKENEILKLKGKLILSRRYLRAANKGAERSSLALNLSCERYHNLMEKRRLIEAQESSKLETFIWNWLAMSDEDYRLKYGELSHQEIKTIRIVLKSMLGNKFNPPNK